MKKKRFMGLLALASCVTLLTGCESDAFFGLGGKFNEIVEWGKGIIGIKDEQEEEEKKEDTPSGEDQGSEGGDEDIQPIIPEITPSLDVDDLPTTIDVRESIDLDDYVTVFGVDGYTVTLDEQSASIASIDGHVVTATGEGDIKFTISAGELSEECAVYCLSSLRADLYYAFGAAGNRYTVLGIEYDEETSQAIVADYYFHSPNYVMTKYFSQDENENVIPGGWLTFGDGDVYQFAIEGEEGSEAVTRLSKSSAVYMSVYNPEITADYYFASSAEYEFDEKYQMDLMVLSGQAAAYWVQDTIMMYGGSFTYQGTNYTISRVEFYEKEYLGKENEVLKAICFDVYCLAEGSEELTYYGNFQVLLGEDAGNDLLDAYCVPENKPASTDYYNDYFGSGIKISDYFISDSGVVPATGLISVSYGWYDEKGGLLVDEVEGEGGATEQVPHTETFYGTSATDTYIFGYGSYNVLCSENSVWEVDSSYKPVSGATKVTVGEGEEAREAVFEVYATEDGYYAEENSKLSSPWDSLVTLPGLRDPENWSDDCISAAQSFVADTIDQGEDVDPYEVIGHAFLFADGEASPLLHAVIDNVGGLLPVASYAALYKYYMGVDFANFFDAQLVVVPEYGYAQFKFSLEMEGDEESDPSTYFNISVSMSYTTAVSSLIASYEAQINPLCE